jgi:nucleotide sugar dehydrogenase
MKIVIIGYGTVGAHLYDELQALKPFVYDKHKSTPRDATLAGRYDVAFICVPTEMCGDGSADTSIVERVIENLDADVIVIKSTVPPGTSGTLGEKYKKRIVFSPEYYGATQHSEDSPNFLILGGHRGDCAKIAQIYYKVKSGAFRIHFTDSKTAELAKYMENCFLALKVTFCAEFANIARNIGCSYEELRELFVLDSRMGDSHTFIYADEPYYDSHCLNKDIPALLSFARAPLMEAMHTANLTQKQNQLKKL